MTHYLVSPRDMRRAWVTSDSGTEDKFLECSGMTDYAQGLKGDTKVSCWKCGLPMAKTQTWRRDKSRANAKSTRSGQLRYPPYTEGLTVNVTRRSTEWEPRGQVSIITCTNTKEYAPEWEPRGQVGFTQDATWGFIYYYLYWMSNLSSKRECVLISTLTERKVINSLIYCADWCTVIDND